jgi:hypothetical protein
VIEAKFQNYNKLKASASFAVDIQSQCNQPTCLTDDKGNCENGVDFKEVTLPDYQYTGSDPALTFDAGLYAEPSSCKKNIRYTCTVSKGDRDDLCSIVLGSEGSTEATFDPVKGTYMLSTVDVQNVAAGDYEFDIMGELGPKSFTIRYKVTLVNPCHSAELTFLPSPFVDETVRLTENPTPQTWTISQIATLSSSVDCGTLDI